MKLRDTNQQVYIKKNSFTHPLSCILPSFSQNASLLLPPKRLSKCASTVSFRKYKRKVVLLVICLINYDLSKSTFFILNLASDFVLSTVFVKQIRILHFLKYEDYTNILLFGLRVF